MYLTVATTEYQREQALLMYAYVCVCDYRGSMRRKTAEIF